MPSVPWLTSSLINRLEALSLSIRWVRTGHQLGGRFAINRRGSSIEFADYTAYSPGDDIRSIDWNLYARLDKLFVKTYKEEIALSVELILDATASMGLPRADKFERVRQIAGCLGYIGLTDQHHVRASWIAPGHRIGASPWFHHRSDLLRLVDLSAAVQPRGRTSLADWMERAALALKMRGGQAIVITDGMMPPAEFFRAMHGLLVRNMDVRVIQVLTPEELRPGALFQGGQVIDAETGQTHQLAYSTSELEEAVTAHNELLARFCKRNGIPFAQDRLDAPLETFVTKTLPARGFLE